MPLPDPTSTLELGRMMTLVLLGPSSAEDTRTIPFIDESVSDSSPDAASLPAPSRNDRADPPPPASRTKAAK